MFVADAKFRANLTRSEAEKVARYGDHLLPADGPPRIYVPPHCDVSDGAWELHDAGRIHIVGLREDGTHLVRVDDD